MKEFRLLNPDEIEVRVSRVNKGQSPSVALLLYKDARCDMNILDETVGCMNWQRHHSRDNANCIVSVWDEEKKQWIEKEDTGTESNTEAAKGLASDSFKRACVNLGIGRELYTSPKNMTFWGNEALITDGKCYDRFEVTDIQYEKRNIVSVTIRDIDTDKTKTFTHNAKPKKNSQEAKVEKEKKDDIKKTMEVQQMIIAPVKAQALISRCESEGVSVSKLCELHKVKGVTELTENQYRGINDNWEKVKEKCSN